MNTSAQSYFIFEVEGGYCGIAWSEAGITRFRLPAKTAEATERHMRQRLPDAEPGVPTPEIEKAVAAAICYFRGEKIDFSDLKLDLQGQEAFFLEIYAATRKLDWGKTTTYGTLAKELGAEPQAARDVGQAMAKNPIPLIIPCHRVLAAGGKIGGFSAPGGSDSKKHMLELEGVQMAVAPQPPAQQSLLF